ncbi:monoheme cytochrome SoxX (sulfur oxidation) [Breoghania corrubedonensis]|uniref:Monoheme cytochrome SoxX (Sulfur oxidation) n=1 Tax=Breoghania corrubedonensis TaxID=665038 RepID=A0A2T5VHX6_9HYPH|nr:sulfur oxidation c-type cytochrome SoxX [Breoghania corrubedonensis]PTW63350.1 monoheme cytochrome SoxX (sulfur oxidation) [Breoghania corrubedonensis]
MRVQMKNAVAGLAVSSVLLGSGIALAGTMAPDAVRIEDMELSQPLTDTAGDPARGREVFAARKLGNCLACHANKDLSNELFHGDVGPSLDGVAGRWSPAQLRAIVVNSKTVLGEATVMPGFYSLDVGADVAEEFAGKTILSAQDVEDVVAYLTTLKQD